MHYKDGTEAKVGDVVKFKRYSSKKSDYVTDVGTLVSAQAGSASCNGQVVAVEFGVSTHGVLLTTILPSPYCITIGECELVHRPE